MYQHAKTQDDRLAASREDLEATHRDLESARKSAQTQIDAIEASRHDVEAANAAQARLLSQVKGEIATLIRQAEQRRAAAEKARSDAEAARLRLLATGRAARTVARAAGTPSTAAAVTHASGGTPGVEEHIRSVVETDVGQETLTAAEFAKKHGWKNDPDKVKLLDGK